jgi:CubicO group peptidase (beta-lactamase class C family)
MHRAASLLALLVIAIVGSARVSGAQGELEQKVDKLFAAYDKPDSPGCALGVIRNGEFIYKRGYGAASLELGVPLTPQSVFYMGSVSKQFTAAAVVLAAEQGYLSLNDDVRKYIPELPSYGPTITLRQMLHHTTGLSELLALIWISGRDINDIHPTAELLDLIVRQRGLSFKSGDEFRYSNTNYFLLAQVVHRATGKPLSRFADENIFKPLGMVHTAFYDDHTVVMPGRVPAYAPGKSGGFSVDWSTNFDKVGEGGLMSSVDDLLLWDRNFYNSKLGKGTLLRELQTRGVLNSGKEIDYALGLNISSYRELPTVDHDGGLFGYRHDMVRFPDQKFSVICLCNLSKANANRLAQQVADIYLEGQFPVALPATNAAAAVPTSNVHVDLRLLVGTYYEASQHYLVEVSALDGNLTGVTVTGNSLQFTTLPGGTYSVWAEPGPGATFTQVKVYNNTVIAFAGSPALDLSPSVITSN